MRIAFLSVLALISSAFFLRVPHAQAHPENIYLEKQVPPYLIDLESDVYVLQADTVSNSAVSFFEPGSLDTPAFDFVRAEILQDGKLLKSQDVPREEFVPESLQFSFPENGTYLLRLEFRKGGAAIAKTDFPLLVGQDMFSGSMSTTAAQYPGGSSAGTMPASSGSPVLPALAGTAAIVAIAFFFRKKPIS